MTNSALDGGVIVLQHFILPPSFSGLLYGLLSKKTKMLYFLGVKLYREQV